ncbi:MAG: right-handed parallel beta-helix repeat-containing protein [Lachnospiraceae bacterium]|nr:right-handed parallel beta-helix repeat-containing protein [Lachnospiraceae bacterium]
MDYNILSYGAVNGGTALSTRALQQAIDDCSKAGGGRVIIPPGEFTIGGIELKSNVDIHFETGAKLIASREREDYTAALTSWTTNDTFNRVVLFYGDGLENVSFSGCGVIEGTGQEDFGRYWGLPTPPPYRIGMIVIENSQNVRISDITVMYSDSWTLHFRACEDVFVTRVKIHNNYFHLNSDGIDPDSCTNVTISDCHITAGDDCIVIKTTQPNAPCRNITVTNCVLETSCAAIKIGTESHSDFSDLRFSNITIRNTTVGCGLFVKDGATMERISFHNISYTYADKEHQKTSIPMYIDVEKRHDNSRLGRVRDISFTNWHIASDVNCVFQSVPESPIQNVTLSNITIRAKKEADRSIRQKSAGSGDRTAKDNGNESVLVQYPAWIAFKNAENLTIRDVSVYQDEGAKGIDMSALYFENVKEVFTENIRLFGAAEGGRPLIACKEEA